MKNAISSLLWASSVFLFISCGNGSRSSGSIGSDGHINLGASLAGMKSPGMTFALDADTEPFVIDNAISVGSVMIAGADDNSLVAYDRERVMIFGKDGKLQSVINKMGNGPQEYVSIFSVYADMTGRQLYITDVHKRNILRYTFEGEYVDVFHDESCGCVVGLPGGNLVMCYSPYSETSSSFGIYDRDWNLVRESSIRKSTIESRILNFDEAKMFNGECYFKKALEDTLYSVTETVEKPVLVIDKGQYKAPDEFYRTCRSSDRYITGENFVIAGGYLFLEFYFNDKMYRDVWDPENGTLFFRTEISDGNDLPGFPVEVNGKTVYCWPNYADGDNLYCILLHSEAKKIIQSIPEDSNPVILHLELE